MFQDVFYFELKIQVTGRLFEKAQLFSQFQPASQEMCSACLKPVYPMERITTLKCIFHKACFSCKQCKKKLR